MAITSSAKKAIKRSAFLRARNLVFKKAMKLSMKNFFQSVDAGADAATLQPLAKEAQSAIDRALKKNIIHKKNAARKKSRVMRALSS